MNELGASNMYEDYSRNASCALRISTLYYYHWIYASVAGIVVTGGIIHPVVSVSL